MRSTPAGRQTGEPTVRGTPPERGSRAVSRRDPAPRLGLPQVPRAVSVDNGCKDRTFETRLAYKAYRA
jgi:hypothetical protein